MKEIITADEKIIKKISQLNAEIEHIENRVQEMVEDILSGELNKEEVIKIEQKIGSAIVKQYEREFHATDLVIYMNVKSKKKLN